MRVGVLTSSRADFGIYFPLLEELKNDEKFSLEIIAFGTHLNKSFGYTLNEIKKAGFTVNYKIETPVKNDSAEDISNSIGNTISLFSNFWKMEIFDLVFCLGDRYEMFAAVVAASPFNLDFAHIHAGETTLGAIDNSYRHSISLMSKYLFVTNNQYKKRATEISLNKNNVFNVGALSIDNLKKQTLYTKEEFKKIFNIDISISSILITFHPETVNYRQNNIFIKELILALEVLKEEYQLVITMPNSDTMGDMIRKEILKFSENKNNVKVIESFGMKGYLTCMKYCDFLLGNTSSGFVEAAFFPKKVINLGNRQEGRIITNNIFNSEITKQDILDTVTLLKNKEVLEDTNIYGNGKAAINIIKVIKKKYGVK